VSREIIPGSRWRFEKPSYLGGRPIVTVKDFKLDGHQVSYTYEGAPSFVQVRSAEEFLKVYEEKVS
jgi:hypothetical protein